MAEQLLKICKAVENKWARSAITLSAAAGLLKQPFHHYTPPHVSLHLHTQYTAFHGAQGAVEVKKKPWAARM